MTKDEKPSGARRGANWAWCFAASSSGRSAYVRPTRRSVQPSSCESIAATTAYRRQKQKQQTVLAYYEEMVLCSRELSEDEKQEFREFEKKHPSSELPGWEHRIGHKQEVASA